jgi:hypothetical protein
VAFGLTALAFLPAVFLLRRQPGLPQPGGGAPAKATRAW